MNEFLDFRGEVSLYENGNLKWTRSNKITYQGRAALLKCLSHSLLINNMRGVNTYTNRIDVNSFLCGVAFGNGGCMDGSVLNRNTSYHDTGLYSPVPIRQLQAEQLTEYKEPATIETFDKYIAFIDDMPAYIGNGESQDINLISRRSPGNYLYFKKFHEVSAINSMKLSDDTQKYDFTSSFVSFSIKIDQEDFKFSSSKNISSISELGLYIGSLQYDIDQIAVEHPEDKENYDPRCYCQDGEDMIYHISKYEDKKYNCSHFVKGSLPIMFSHITFPAEDILEPKDLTFKYTIFV